MRRGRLYSVFFLALAGFFLFAAQSAWAVFTEVSATAAYNEVKNTGTDAVIIDVRSVDENNGKCPPWGPTGCAIAGATDTNTAYNGTPKWRLNGKTYLPINIPWWVNENTTFPTLAPDDSTEVTNIIEGLLERGVIDFNTRLYFLCRTGVRSRYMATWMDGRTFTSTKTGSGTFANLYNIDGDGTGAAEGGMSEWNTGTLPKYMGMGEFFSFTTVPPQVFATFDGSTTFTVSILEPTPSGYFNPPPVTRVSLQIFDSAGYRGNEVAFSPDDTSGALWTDYTFDAASTTAPFDIPAGTYTWRALAANNAGRGLNNHALGVSDISAIEAEASASARTGIIIDVRTWEEHNGCAVTGQAPFTYDCGSTSSNARSPLWTDTATGVTVLPPNVPFWISSYAGAFPEDTLEFESILGYLKQAGVINFNTRIYLISASGYRGYWAGAYMQKLGFRNVYSIDSVDTYADGGMPEWYTIAGLATNPEFHGPQIYAVTPSDEYANGAVPFKVGILEVTRADGRGHPCVSDVSLYVDDLTTTPAATSNVDTVEGTLWTEYTFTNTPAAGSHTWNVRAQGGWGSVTPYDCPAANPTEFTMWNLHAYAAGPGDRSLGVAEKIMVTYGTGNTDLEIGFGDVPVGGSATTQTITVTNNGTTDLTGISTSLATYGADAFLPFSITDNCSSTLGASANCTIDVDFSPATAGSFGRVLRINSSDTGVPQVAVAMCGTGGGTAPRWTYSAATDTSDLSDSDLLSLLSDCAVPAAIADNTAPDAPELYYPSDGDANVPTNVTFVWKESTDADGDTVSYQICYAPEGTELDSSTCKAVPVEGDVVKGSSSTLYAGLGSVAGLLLFGMMLAGSARRRKLALLIGLMAITAMFLVSCGKSTTDTSVPGIKTYPATLVPGESYTWKVIASDGRGGEASSEVWSFTTGNRR
ncbi:MAG: choice-of-anchor D domain-containing protein [Nitrospirota bacterium]|nr:choice-of-anchor D domain-containing protein [Nitrospirota bacterium]